MQDSIRQGKILSFSSRPVPGVQPRGEVADSSPGLRQSARGSGREVKLDPSWAYIFETKIAVLYCESQNLDVTRQCTTDLVFSKHH